MLKGILDLCNVLLKPIIPDQLQLERIYGLYRHVYIRGRQSSTIYRLKSAKVKIEPAASWSCAQHNNDLNIPEMSRRQNA